MLISRLILLSVFAILAGCSYPMDYQSRATPTFPAGRTKEKVVVVGVDRRDYLLKKEIKPQYVGLFRDLMVAIPYKWVTKSKNPVSDDLAINTAKGLQNAGYLAVAVKNPAVEDFKAGMEAARAMGATRILVVRVNELESDTMWRTEYRYDLVFELYSGTGKLLASHPVKDTIMIGATPFPTVTAQIKVPTKAGEITAEGVTPLLKEL